MRGLYAGMSTKDREKILLNLLGSQRPVLVPSNLVIPAQLTGHGSGGDDDDGTRTTTHRARARTAPTKSEPEPSAQSRWIKPLSCYERRETTLVEGLRYG
jgi:hypothetical protein